MNKHTSPLRYAYQYPQRIYVRITSLCYLGKWTSCKLSDEVNYVEKKTAMPESGEERLGCKNMKCWVIFLSVLLIIAAIIIGVICGVCFFYPVAQGPWLHVLKSCSGRRLQEMFRDWTVSNISNFWHIFAFTLRIILCTVLNANFSAKTSLRMA